ncbi:unnamed protein product [Effrenium voratum]|nr:unnamed protein product [Effrenium voratum]
MPSPRHLRAWFKRPRGPVSTWTFAKSRMFALFIAACSLAEAARLENHATNALNTLDLDRTLWKKRDKAEAIETLEQITEDRHKPNPRISCSAGLNHARDVLVAKAKSLSLKPMGTDGYRFTVPGTQHPTHCVDGITNIIAGIEGTDDELKHEYILITSHLDGPENEGGSGVLGATDNSYDDAAAVAASLALAKHFQESPPKRSLIFAFSDAEEGITNIDAPEEWVRRLCDSNIFKKCSNYPIGLTAWVDNPTVSLMQVKLVLALDPLGAPGIKGSDFVALLGTESTPQLRELMQETWPDDSVTPLFVNRMYADQSYSDADSMSMSFGTACAGATCIRGIPFVWFAQPAFHKYHGGLRADLVRVMNMIPGVSFPESLASTELDTRASLDTEALQKVTETLKVVIQRLADKAEVSNLRYHAEVYTKIQAATRQCGKPVCGFSLQDAINNKQAYDFLAAALSKPESVTTIPAQMALQGAGICQQMSRSLAAIIGRYHDAPDPSKVIPAELPETAPSFLAALAMGIDFFTTGPGRLSLA